MGLLLDGRARAGDENQACGLDRQAVRRLGLWRLGGVDDFAGHCGYPQE